MPSHDLTIDNGAGQVVRLDIQDALQAIATCMAGASAPDPTYPNMTWLDTSGTPLILKKRNHANSGWFTVATIAGDAYVPWRDGKAIDEVATAKSNLAATTDPGVTDDGNAGYAKGSKWLNTATPEVFELLDPTPGAAVWKSLSAQGVVAGIRFTSPPDIDPSGSGTDSIAIGDNAATGTASQAVAIGPGASLPDGSTGSVALGNAAGWSSGGAAGGNYNTLIGSSAGSAAAGTASFGGSNTVIGSTALRSTGGNIVANANAVVVGAGAAYASANVTLGNYAVLIGGNVARASGTGSSVTIGDDVIAIGREACRNTNTGVAHTVSLQSISIGYRANYNATAGAQAVALGANTLSTGTGSLAIGNHADASGDFAIAIGGGDSDATSADATATNAIAIGYNALAGAANAVAMGPGVESTAADTLAIGTGNTNKLTMDASGHIKTTAALDALVVNSTIADDISGIRCRAFRPHLTLEDVSTDATDFQVWADGGKLSILSGDASSPGKLATREMEIDPAAGIIDLGGNRLTNFLAPVQVGTFVEGKPESSEVILRYVAAKAFTLPQALTASVFKAATAATAQTVFSIKKNGGEVATATVAATATTATFAAASQTSFAIGDVLTIVAPASADATLADFAITLAGDLA